MKSFWYFLLRSWGFRCLFWQITLIFKDLWGICSLIRCCLCVLAVFLFAWFYIFDIGIEYFFESVHFISEFGRNIFKHFPFAFKHIDFLFKDVVLLFVLGQFIFDLRTDRLYLFGFFLSLSQLFELVVKFGVICF